MNEFQSQIILDQNTGFLINTNLKPKISHMKGQKQLTEAGNSFSNSLNRSKYYQNTFAQPLLAGLKSQNQQNGQAKGQSNQNQKKLRKNVEMVPISSFGFNNCFLFDPGEKPDTMTKEKRSIQVIKNIFEKREKIRAQSAHEKKRQSKLKDNLNNSKKRMHTNHSQISDINEDRSYILETGEDDIHQNSEFQMIPLYTEPDLYQNDHNLFQQYNSLYLQASNSQNSRITHHKSSSLNNQLRSPISIQGNSSSLWQIATPNDKIYQKRNDRIEYEEDQRASPYFEQWHSDISTTVQENNRINNNQIMNPNYIDKIKNLSQKNKQSQMKQQNKIKNQVTNNFAQDISSELQYNQVQQNILEQEKYKQQQENYSQLQHINDEMSTSKQINMHHESNQEGVDERMFEYYQQNKVTADQVVDNLQNQYSHQLQHQYSQSVQKQDSMNSQVKGMQNSQQVKQKGQKQVVYYNVLPIQKQQIFDDTQYQMIVQTKNNYLKTNNISHPNSGMQSKTKSPCNHAVKAQHFISQSHSNKQIDNTSNYQSLMPVRLDQLNLQQVDWGKVMKKEKPIHSNSELQRNSKHVLRNINNQKFQFIRNASLQAQNNIKDANKSMMDMSNSTQLNNNNSANANQLELCSMTQNVKYGTSQFFFKSDSQFRPQTSATTTTNNHAQKLRPTTSQMPKSTQKYNNIHASSSFYEKINRMHQAKSSHPIQNFISKQGGGGEEGEELDILINRSQLLDPASAKDAINSSYNQSFYLQKTTSSISDHKPKYINNRQAITPTRYLNNSTRALEDGNHYIRPLSVSSKRSQHKQQQQNLEQSINNLFKDLGVRNKIQPLRLNTFS